MNAVKEKAIYYGKMACDTMMRNYHAPDLPPKGGFHYHAGVFLSGMLNIYSVCGEEKYFTYTKEWVDSIVKDDGVIDCYSKGALDDYMAGILLFPLYEKTGMQKYIDALNVLLPNLRNWHRNEYGGFWHMEWRPFQMWLDGLYMAGPLMAAYAEKQNKPVYAEIAAEQAQIMYEHMQDPSTKLLYHAWDPSKRMPWADNQTGLSPEFWGRALGWYAVALLDILEHMDASCEKYQKLARIEREVLTAIFQYQDRAKKLWYQVTDKGDVEGNWLEASCSCLYIYAAFKAARMKIMDGSLLGQAGEGFAAVIDRFVQIEEGKLVLSGVCVGTGVMDMQGYFDRPRAVNDLHGMGAFLLMCAEIARQ